MVSCKNLPRRDVWVTAAVVIADETPLTAHGDSLELYSIGASSNETALTTIATDHSDLAYPAEESNTITESDDRMAHLSLEGQSPSEVAGYSPTGTKLPEGRGLTRVALDRPRRSTCNNVRYYNDTASGDSDGFAEGSDGFDGHSRHLTRISNRGRSLKDGKGKERMVLPKARTRFPRHAHDPVHYREYGSNYLSGKVSGQARQPVSVGASIGHSRADNISGRECVTTRRPRHLPKSKARSVLQESRKRINIPRSRRRQNRRTSVEDNTDDNDQTTLLSFLTTSDNPSPAPNLSPSGFRPALYVGSSGNIVPPSHYSSRSGRNTRMSSSTQQQSALESGGAMLAFMKPSQTIVSEDGSEVLHDAQIDDFGTFITSHASSQPDLQDPYYYKNMVLRDDFDFEGNKGMGKRHLLDGCLGPPSAGQRQRVNR
jgi:hypothetical protein